MGAAAVQADNGVKGESWVVRGWSQCIEVERVNEAGNQQQITQPHSLFMT